MGPSSAQVSKTAVERGDAAATGPRSFSPWTARSEPRNFCAFS